MNSPSFLQHLQNESRLIRKYLRKYRSHALIGVLALTVVNLLETVPPLLLKHAVDAVTGARPREWLAIAALVYLGITGVQALGRYLWRMYLIRASMWAGRDMRDEYAAKLFELSASFFDRKRVGDLMSLATNDVEAVRMAMGAGLLTLADAVFFLASVPAVMFWLSPQLTLWALAPLLAVPWIVVRCERLIHERFQKVQAQFGVLAAISQEGLNGIRVLKAYAREGEQVGRLSREGEEFVRLNLRLSRVQSAFGPTLDFVMSLGLVLVLYRGGVASMEGAVTLGTFVAFQRYLQKMVWPMMAVGLAITMYQRAVASGKRFEEILATPSDVPPPVEPKLPESSLPGGPFRTAGRVEFRDLTFRFPTGGRDVLKRISLTIEPGERVAFLGAVGAGKSALLALLPRLYPVDPGMLYVDGIDINEWPLQELRRQVGFVSQDVLLFSDTVRENVSFGLFQWVDHGGQWVRVERAAKMANVLDEVGRLTQGWQTRLGERGVNLSGGQKQRLTIARALAKEPPILVLDDALSSVDTQTEEAILSALRSRSGRNTELVAAHRISTIQDADRIVVLEQGEIRQLGTHQELEADRRGAYRAFVEQQRLREELEALT